MVFLPDLVLEMDSFMVLDSVKESISVQNGHHRRKNSSGFSQERLL